ncbi:dentin sialophosphoprotein-like [Diaphorina citri]|uniref:Dentin sialophosphoprotein-like n=1 Tax=Diaphorina citri TaxID=121845 RepID=A0A1S3DDI0_DIACI|nr:dentin sialophosphoprotein-like [Diaphorina citri]
MRPPYHEKITATTLPKPLHTKDYMRQSSSKESYPSRKISQEGIILYESQKAFDYERHTTGNHAGTHQSSRNVRSAEYTTTLPTHLTSDSNSPVPIPSGSFITLIHIQEFNGTTNDSSLVYENNGDASSAGVSLILRDSFESDSKESDSKSDSSDSKSDSSDSKSDSSDSKSNCEWISFFII